MPGWLQRNAKIIEATSAMATALAAFVALVGVKIQIDEAAHVQALQSARAAYLAQQALAVQNPKFVAPVNACALMASADGPAYEAFVTHLLFTAEQMLEVSAGWETTFHDEFLPHAAYLCRNADALNASEALEHLLAEFAREACADVPPCGQDAG